jgi:hypothetical protein
MNRVLFNVLEQGTSVNAKGLVKLQNPTPYEDAYLSEQFPVYPITICMYLENPPFNKFSICFGPPFVPSKGTLYGSEDGHKYTKIHDFSDLKERKEYTKIFNDKLPCTYIRLVLEAPLKDKDNICKQIRIKGL